jgi:anti-sigma-K factor RskA
MSEDHVLDLLPVYVLGVLEADEVRHVEAHLRGCAHCRAELRSLQIVTDHLALTAPPAVPRPEVKERLMLRLASPAGAGRERARPGIREVRPSWGQRLLPAWGLASLVLILALAAFSLALWQRLNRLEYLTAPGGMRAVALNATSAAPQATGFVLIGVDGRNGALVVDRLPPLEEGREYQVWLIRDGERTSGAVFSIDEEGYRGLRIEAPRSLLDYSAVEVTIEPAGGSLQPTGAAVLGGPLFNG